MPRRIELRSIASGIVQSFMSRNNDAGGYWAPGKFYRHAQRCGRRIVVFNLMTGELDPPPAQARDACLREPDVTQVRQRYESMLWRLMERCSMPREWVIAAQLTMEFECAEIDPFSIPPGASATPFRCTVSLTDDLFRDHDLRLAGWCWPHDPWRENRRAMH